MKIPKGFKIGRRVFLVFQPWTISPNAACRGGLCNADSKTLDVAHSVQGKLMSERRRAQVFWHETMHAILHDMDDPRWRDEAFVEAIAKRLTDVVYSARF